MRYGSKEYWEQRYRGAAEPEDWLQTWGALRPLVAPHLPKDGTLLVLGCGTSTLAEELWDDGWRDVLGVDYSAAAVERMRARAGERPGLRYAEMDVCALALPAASCAAAFDKGTLDALMCGDEPAARVGAMLAEVARVLRPGAPWVCVSMRPARARAHLFAGWQVTTARVDKQQLTPRSDDVDDEQHQEMNSNWVYLLRRV